VRSSAPTRPVADEGSATVVADASSLPAQQQYALFAKAVNLRPSDLPGYRHAPHKSTRHSASSGGGLVECLGTGGPKAVFKRNSETLTREEGAIGSLQLGSEVEVWRSASGLARKTSEQKAALRKPHTLSCMRRAVDKMLPGTVKTRQGVKTRITVSGVAIAPIETGRPAGTDATIGATLKFTAHYTFEVAGRRFVHPVQFYLDALAFNLGKAQVGLSAVGVAKPAPANVEASLFSTLLSRALEARRSVPALS
jgi:hypothetical protein